MNTNKLFGQSADARRPYRPGCACGESESCQTCEICESGGLVSDWSDTGAAPEAGLSAEVLKVGRLSHDVVRLRVRLLEGQVLNFRAGQSAVLHIDGLPDRLYAMACSPEADHLSFHVREDPGCLVSRVIGHHLYRGDRVGLSGPHGDAWWRKNDDAERYVLVGGGTGLAPMLAVLAAALTDDVQGDKLHVYHGVRTREDLYADELLTAMAAQHGFNYQAVLSHDQADDDIRLREGMAHEALAQDFDSMLQTQVYAAGPSAMVDAVRAFASSRGVLPDAFHADPFFAAEPPVQHRRSLWSRLKRAGSQAS